VTTPLIGHPACLLHDMGEGHPEQPDRLRVIDQAMESEVFQMLARDVAPRAEISAIARVHPLDYIEAIRAAMPTQGHTAIDDETSVSPGSFEAALRSAGGGILAVDEVMSRKVRKAFVATRPPGHHAEVATPMGFCFFNNAAIAARHAQAAYGAERVAIVDFDVHHGNGTQHIFWNDKTIMYASTHEMPRARALRSALRRDRNRCAAFSRRPSWRWRGSSAQLFRRRDWGKPGLWLSINTLPRLTALSTRRCRDARATSLGTPIRIAQRQELEEAPSQNSATNSLPLDRLSIEKPDRPPWKGPRAMLVRCWPRRWRGWRSWVGVAKPPAPRGQCARTSGAGDL
jgi:Histone deacetylase domain